MSALFPRVLLMAIVAGLVLPVIASLRAEEAPRVSVAVIDVAGQPDVAALVTASLSQIPGCTVVERSEIAKLTDEKKLQESLGRRNYGNVGALTKADGLILIDTLGQGSGAPPTIRLVAVKTGICLFAQILAKSDPQEQLKAISFQWTRLFPKLLVAHADALPVSLLNLRAAVFTPEMAGVERELSRLVELYLSVEPRLFLLERRNLGSVSFERDLDAADVPPLRNSATVVDGTILKPDSSDGVRVVLRVRDIEAAPRTVELAGKTSDITALAREICTTLLKDTKAGANPAEWPGQAEAAEFFQESVWAWRHHLYGVAYESIISARALGDESPDAHWLESWLSAEEASPKEEFYGGKRFQPVLKPLDERSDLVFQAMAEKRDYLAAGGSSKLINFDAKKEQEVREGQLGGKVLSAASAVLVELTAVPTESSRAAAMKALVREVAPFDPGNGKFPARFPQPISILSYWSNDFGEVLAYCRCILYSDEKQRFWMARRFMLPRSEVLGRYAGNSDAEKAFDSFVDDLQREPKAHLFGLLAMTRQAASDALREEAYRKALTELTERVNEFATAGRLEDYLAAAAVDTNMTVKFPHERAALLQAVFARRSEYSPVALDQMRNWLTLPDDLAPGFWKDFVAYREGCLAGAPTPEERMTRERMFVLAASVFLDRHPALETEPSHGALKVTRFSCPYSRGHRIELGGNDIICQGHDVWRHFMGNGSREGDGIYRATLPSLKWERIGGEEAHAWGYLQVDAASVYFSVGVYPGNDQPMRFEMRRMNRSDGRWSVFPINGQVTALHAVGGDLYVSTGTGNGIGGSGLAMMDWKAGALTPLASSRRKPPQNQLDDCEPYHVVGVVEGPGAKPLAMIAGPVRKALFISKEKGTWRELPGLDVLEIQTYEHSCLVRQYDRSLVYLDSRTGKIEPWLRANKEADSEANLWDGTVDWSIDFNLITFRFDELFILNRSAEMNLSLQWYWKGGPRQGLTVPLAFDLPAGVKALVDGLGHENSSSKDLSDPGRAIMGVKLRATPDGLILAPISHGFWFIPNADLTAFKAGQRGL